MSAPEVGSEVRLLAPVAPWYSGYGGRPSVRLEAGALGYVRSVGVPRVRGRGRDYAVAVFELDGTAWQVSDIEASWEVV